ncbi:MAG: class I SAM-dependent methyltransferase [Nitrospinota bacterium]|nr:class I SAM-dependent methyltransferase [Nitrospinota bacterium]
MTTTHKDSFAIHVESEKRKCPLCGSKEHSFAYFAEFKVNKVSYDRCKYCGAIFQNPLLTFDSLSAVYNSKAYWGTDDKDEYIYSSYSEQESQYMREAARRYHLMAKSTRFEILQNIKVLEIGSGAGFSAVPFINNRIDISGVEPSIDMANHARNNFGMKVFLGLFEDLTFDKSSYNIVFTWGTSMNFREPEEVYRKVFHLLKPGGSLFLDFLDMNSIFSIYTYRKRKKGVHITCAPTRTGIKTVLEKCGFRTITFKRVFPYYSISFLASQLDSALLKRIAKHYPFNKLGVYVPAFNFYIVQAVKQDE